MRDPNDPIWEQLRGETSWDALLEHLDRYGLIAEADSHLDDSRNDSLRAYADFAERAQDWLAEVAAALSPAETELLQSSARASLRLAAALLEEAAAEIGIGGAG
jgi:hypothetical protein